ncbi:HalOD1 output domain-containing protein [Halopiger xanaduensis]|uniref:Halobacterial output domain-containing protein n=1 Tax=Halopiger xanaduensis (strain DSM 18323 / JCM 14033 / SH-6) TaxID=797210 RepID=F8D555_HALXS|nr:HalOD1 output domain-containing protein [Halopiger xanaduensis]AEH36407.1 hypothetical protein Halxa_1779 [Halopiger xanaduensis SH-6]
MGSKLRDSSRGDADGESLLRRDCDDNEPITVAVIDAVSRVAGVAPTALPPLYETIDPDALDGVFDAGSSDGESVRVAFSYADHEVVVQGGPRVTVTVTPDGT